MFRRLIMLGAYGLMGIGSLALVLALLTDTFPMVVAGAVFTLLGMFLWWMYGD